eukprot:14136289-Ditylum_brightwellii.AAC.1
MEQDPSLVTIINPISVYDIALYDTLPPMIQLKCRVKSTGIDTLSNFGPDTDSKGAIGINTPNVVSGIIGMRKMAPIFMLVALKLEAA